MNIQLLNLSRSQMSLAWAKARHNQYSDTRKQIFHQNLEDLFKAISEFDFTLMTDDEKYEARNIMEWFISSVNLLNNNTVNIIPYEMIECLNIASKEWLSDYDKYIIVTTDGPYAILISGDSLNIIYDTIKNKFGIDFQYRLLEIRMPRYLNRDYLTNVCLYHELGHFVDKRNKISETIVSRLYDQWHTQITTRPEIKQSFPFITDFNSKNNKEIEQIYFHIREYFADIFAAQYVGQHIENYLIYLAEDRKNIHDYEHPSLELREIMINNFLSNNYNTVLNSIIEESKNIYMGKLQIQKSYIDLQKEDFYNLVPTQIQKESEIHSLFKLGWDIWMNNTEQIKICNKMQEELPPDKTYEIINNLIEKSINNYLIIRDWENFKKI